MFPSGFLQLSFWVLPDLADMGLLADVENVFNQARCSPLLERAFERWQEETSTFRRFAHIEDLISFCRTPDENYVKKNPIFSLLCTKARKGDTQARLLLLWLFLPGLWAVRDRLAEHEFLDSDELEAELVAGFWRAAARIRRGSRRVTGQLLNAARNGALSAAVRAVSHEKHRFNLRADLEFHNWNKPLPVVLPEPTEEAEAAGIITNFQARLIESTRLDGVSLAEFASWLGTTRNALNLQRWRAEAQLLQWLRPQAHIEESSAADEMKPAFSSPCIGAGNAERSLKDGNEIARTKGEETPSCPVLHSGPFEPKESPE